MTIHVLKIGDLTRAEAAPLSYWISKNLQPADVREFLDFTVACDEIARARWIPDFVIVFQAWSDEFVTSDLQKLLSLAPLARAIVCHGAWCESDGRTRQLWPVALGISISSAPARLIREWRGLSQQSGAKVLPLSASRDEVFDSDHSPLVASGKPSIGVDSPDVAYRQYLIELLRSVGYAAEAIHESNESYDAVLFDADPCSIRCDRLRAMRIRYASLPIVATAALPHEGYSAALKQSGATSVVPKLCNQQAILNALVSKE